MTGQSAVQALPCFNVSEHACNAGLPFLTSAEQVIVQDQTEYDNTKSKKITVQKQHNGHADGDPE